MLLQKLEPDASNANQQVSHELEEAIRMSVAEAHAQEGADVQEAQGEAHEDLWKVKLKSSGAYFKTMGKVMKLKSRSPAQRSPQERIRQCQMMSYDKGNNFIDKLVMNFR